MRQNLYLTPLLALGALISVALLPQSILASNVVTIRVQTAVPENADELAMLGDFAERVERLTNGRLKLDLLAAGEVASPSKIIEAVDEGLVEAGFAWTHYWTRYHPAAMLFGSPIAGAGVGLDTMAFLSWYMHGGGRSLYDRLWSEAGLNVKGFLLQPGGPEALGWFREPIANMNEFRKRTFRSPPGTPGDVYEDMGIATLPLAAADIVPALESGLIDAAEWCCPKPDRVFGLHETLKHYYLQGLHQVVVNADIYFNGDVWRNLPQEQRDIIELAADASLMSAMTYRIRENGRALERLVKEDGVTLHDTPLDYFDEFMAAAEKVLQRNADGNEFFREVWESQRKFAETVVPYWTNAQRTNTNLGQAFIENRADIDPSGK